MFMCQLVYNSIILLISDVFRDEAETKMLIVQCDSGDSNTDLIACARHRLVDERQKPTCKGTTHVIFIVQLPRVAGGTTFTSFQGGLWTSIHIDELMCPKGANQIVNVALKEPMHKLFQMLIEEDKDIPQEYKVCIRVKDNVQVAVSKIISRQNYDKMERLIDNLLKLILDDVPGTGKYYHHQKAINLIMYCSV